MPKFNSETDEIEESGKSLDRSKLSDDVEKALMIDSRAILKAKEKAMAPRATDKDGVAYFEGRLFEPRCHVCLHPYRDWVEMMLIKGASYKGLQERIPPLEGHSKLDRRSISNHHKKHMDLQDTALRAILEHEADLQARDYAEGVEDAITKRGVLEVMLRKGYEDVVSGITSIEARDLIQMVKVLGDMDTHQSQVGLDEARAQVQIFIQAIKNVCDLDTQSAIAQEVKKLRSRESIDAKFETMMNPPGEISEGSVEELEPPEAEVIT